MKIYFLALFAMLAACAGPPSPEQVASADYGPYPDNYEQIVRNYHRTYLKDPSTAQYRGFSTPMKVWWGNRMSGAKFGYRVCVTYNARNSYGGYVGFKTDAALINNGRVIDYLPNGENFGHNVCTEL